MWTCHNCENTNNDDSSICNVCGATVPNVSSISWDNIKGDNPDKPGFATVRWSSMYSRSIFAVFNGVTYYLTGKTSAEFKIPEEETSGVIYFCSSAGYIEYHFTLGSSEPLIKMFRVYNICSPGADYKIGDLACVEWETKNGETTVSSEAFNTTIRESGLGSIQFIVNSENIDIDISVIKDGCTSALAELSIKAIPVKKAHIEYHLVQDDKEVKPSEVDSTKPLYVKYSTTCCRSVSIAGMNGLSTSGSVEVPPYLYKWKTGKVSFRITALTSDISDKLYSMYYMKPEMTKSEYGFITDTFFTDELVTFDVNEPEATVEFIDFSKDEIGHIKEGDIATIEWKISKNATHYAIKNDDLGVYYRTYHSVDGTSSYSTVKEFQNANDYNGRIIGADMELHGGDNHFTVYVINHSGTESQYHYAVHAKKSFKTKLKSFFKK